MPVGLAQQALGTGRADDVVGNLTPGDDGAASPTDELQAQLDRLNDMRHGVPDTAFVRSDHKVRPRLDAEIVGSAIPAAPEPAEPVVPMSKRTSPHAVQMSLEGALRVVIALIDSGKVGEAVRMLSSIADQLPAHLREPKVMGER